MSIRVLGEFSNVTVGLYVDSCCGRCGYGLDRANDRPVALASADDVLDGESLCLRCFSEDAGDRLSATHKA